MDRRVERVSPGSEQRCRHWSSVPDLAASGDHGRRVSFNPAADSAVCGTGAISAHHRPTEQLARRLEGCPLHREELATLPGRAVTVTSGVRRTPARPSEGALGQQSPVTIAPPGAVPQSVAPAGGDRGDEVFCFPDKQHCGVSTAASSTQERTTVSHMPALHTDDGTFRPQ
jgi:hypothetical protein